MKADVSTETGLHAIESALAGRPLSGVFRASGSSIALSNYEDLKSDDFCRDMQVHVSAPITINNLLVQQLTGFRVIYIDSYSAMAPRVVWTGYSIVKAVAQMAAKSAAAETSYASVIRVFPGGVRTPIVEAVPNSESVSPTALAFIDLDEEGAIV